MGRGRGRGEGDREREGERGRGERGRGERVRITGTSGCSKISCDVLQNDETDYNNTTNLLID